MTPNDEQDDVTMDEMTRSDLALCAENVRVGWGLMLAAEGQIAQGKAQWIEGVLKAAAALVRARNAMSNDAEFGKWCSDNGLSLRVINHNDRAALVRIGADTDYWRDRIAHSESRSLPRIVANDIPPEVSPARIPARHETKPGPKPRQAPSTNSPAPKVAPAESKTDATPPAKQADPATVKPTAGYDTGSIPWPPTDSKEIKAVATVMARNPKQALRLIDAVMSLLQGTDHPVTFAPAQLEDIEAFKVAFKKTVRKEEIDYQKRVWANFDQAVLDETAKRVAERIEKLAPGLLEREAKIAEAQREADKWRDHWREKADKASIFTSEEDRNIMMALHPDNSASKETRDAAMGAYGAQRWRLVASPPRTKVSPPLNIKPRNPPPPRPQ
jgi:hypothetical protein